jgi:hypothetical protein
MLGPVLTGLRDKSRARVAVDPGFRLVREELALSGKNEESKLLSLNETDRRRAKSQADKIGEQMKKVILINAARMPPADYVTLDEVDPIGTPNARKLAQRSAAVAKPGETNPFDDIELSEVENILADYIQAFPAP